MKVKDKVTTFVKLESAGVATWWKATKTDTEIVLHETQEIVVKADGTKYINGAAESSTNKLREVGTMSKIEGQTEVKTGSLNPFSFLAKLGSKDTMVRPVEERRVDPGRREGDRLLRGPHSRATPSPSRANSSRSRVRGSIGSTSCRS